MVLNQIIMIILYIYTKIRLSSFHNCNIVPEIIGHYFLDVKCQFDSIIVGIAIKLQISTYHVEQRNRKSYNHFNLI